MCIKLLFDQNLSYRLVLKLKEIYPNSTHVETVKLDSSSDIDVWRYAKDNGYVLVSKDSDFNDICTLYNFPPHIIWLRLGNSRVSEVEKALVKYRDRIFSIIEKNITGIIEIN